MDCQAFQAKLPIWLPDLVFSPESAPAAVREHLLGCAPCTQLVQAERAATEATLGLLESWEAPEPSPFFAARMHALLREEAAKPRPGWAGWWERMRTGMLVSNMHLKPVLGGGALALLLVAGGGAYLGLNQAGTAPSSAPAVKQTSATVRDLQSLDENAGVFQQLSSIDQGEDNAGTL